jgi:hypothetical protein
MTWLKLIWNDPSSTLDISRVADEVGKRELAIDEPLTTW